MSDIEKLNDTGLDNVSGGVKSELTIAYEVIDGKWGNGQDRINRLRGAGYDAAAIQQLVNSLLKQQKPANPGYRDPYLG